MNVREATKELHDAVEEITFAQRLLSGDFTKDDYGRYLLAQEAIFDALENWDEYVIPHSSLYRYENIIQDYAYLNIEENPETPSAAIKYGHYLLGFTEYDDVKKNSHLYLNYLGLMFGGSIVAKNIPTEGLMYRFDNRTECIKAIRELELDIEEVKRGFEYQIRIMEELEELRNNES